ncbi:MAG: hypothetical protein IKE38_00125 [Erysipelotrichaceae bacterium]|nr:hypothetical protein [Erysipelotrichaceae bacterium]
MVVLEFINAYIKYVYLVLIAVLLVLIIRLLRKTGTLNSGIGPLNDSVSHMNEKMAELNEKKAVIENTITNSLPFFIKLFFLLSVLYMAIDDYFKTRYSKRDFNRSLRKAYKYRSAMKELKMLKRSS